MSHLHQECAISQQLYKRIEMGMKNHEYIPYTIVTAIANIRTGGVHKILKNLVQKNFVTHKVTKKMEGFSLNYSGYDALALRVLFSKGAVYSVGNQIGVGKESDIYIVADETGKQFCLKLHRLGRTSFRQLKNKRDYHGSRTSMSWLYLSRISATREFLYMKSLYENNFPVPEPINHNRHAVIMELLDARNLTDVRELSNVEKSFNDCINCVLRFAQQGVIHGDFNEFNLMMDADENLRVIDFPQLVSVYHKNAQFYFERDVDAIFEYFCRKFKYEPSEYPSFEDIKPVFPNCGDRPHWWGMTNFFVGHWKFGGAYDFLRYKDAEDHKISIVTRGTKSDASETESELEENLSEIEEIIKPVTDKMDPKKYNNRIKNKIKNKQKYEQLRRAHRRGEATKYTKMRRDTDNIVRTDSVYY
ncbi:RIO-type serine/threonine-protein kinase Rio2 [Intoshia linei]|uniref:non-specific serine/threonine protein kinase n=1 Tax=Intoshia linei TaxID=1819745 RepID=A0A177ATK1_9BILA|nr:RIO-type serine/threonine-protein kinase Rio2 [Intoshia linei]